MEKIKYRLVFNRRKQLNKDGKALIQVEASLNKQRMYFSTHIFIEEGQWDNKKRQVMKHALAEEYNTRLYAFIIDLEVIEMSFWRKDIPVTLALLKQAVRSETHANMPFCKFAEHCTSHSSKKDSTKANLRTTIKLLEHFRSNITFNDLTYSFLREFEEYLRFRGCKVNTIAKHLRQLRTFVNESINAGFIRVEDYPFRKYSIHHENPVHMFLSETEMNKLERQLFPEKNIQHTCDAFLFCTFTGLRFSDFIHLKQANLIKAGGHSWLNVKMIKTNIPIKIPLDLLFDGKALKIIGKYKTLERLADIGSNAKANRRLKKIAKACKIDKALHWHAARHTFSVLLMEKGVPITTIQKLLGHTSIRTTQVYSEVTLTAMIKDLTKAKTRNKAQPKV